MLERLANIRHTTAIIATSISLLFFAVILFSVRTNLPSRSFTEPAELIPTTWETVTMPRYSFGYPPSWVLTRTDDGFVFTDEGGERIATVRDITNIRSTALAELNASPALSSADFAFADQPARRYLYPDRNVYIVAVARRAYRIDTLNDTPNISLFLATIRFF